MSSAGLILTITGGIISATTLLLLLINYVGEHGFGEQDQNEPNTYAILNLFGDAAMIVGIPLWLTGIVRGKKAQLTLQNFRIEPENSMAVGLGITLRF